MKKDEVVTLLRVIAGYYPNWKYNELEWTIELWHNILVDYEPDVIFKNLRDYVKSGKEFVPIVGQLVPQKEKSYGPAIPSLEETRQYILEMQKPRENIPTREELEKIWAEGNKLLGITKG